MTPPLIEMRELLKRAADLVDALDHEGLFGDEVAEFYAALEAEQRVGVVFDAEPQIRAWVNGTHDQMEFWRRVALSAAESAGLGKTQEEAANLTSYFEGQYDQALKVRDFLLQKIGGLNLAAPTPQRLAELQANERRLAAIAGFEHIAINQWMVQICANGRWHHTYYKAPQLGTPEHVAADINEAICRTIDAAIDASGREG